MGRLAPKCARLFTVIIPDLRCYGESAALPYGAGHTVYPKCMMLRDILALMDTIGLGKAGNLGHDRLRGWPAAWCRTRPERT